MGWFGTLFTSSKPSMQPLRVLKRPLVSYRYPTEHSNKHRFFTSQAIAQEDVPSYDLEYPQSSHVKGVEEKSSSGTHVASIQNVKPYKPTPDNQRSYKLSALDQLHIPYYIPFIFFYRNNFNGTNNMDDIVLARSKLLKQSLSETLTQFYPFAGKYNDESHIDCNDEGVYYIETSVDGDLLSFLTKPDYMLLQRLLPKPPNSKKQTRGSYLVMIQVNFFDCGGIAIGMCNSHKLIDGMTYMTFVNAWAAAARGNPRKNLVYTNLIPSSILLEDNQPPTNPAFQLSFLTVRPSMLKDGKCLTKRFVFQDKTKSELKTKANVSRVVAVTSLIWKCATNAARKQHAEQRPSILQFVVNLRGKFVPSLPHHAIGNIIWNTAKKGYEKVIDEIKLLGRELSNYDADYYSVSSICRSGVYEADFGWGKPVWTCYANFCNDVPLYTNSILLMDTSTSDGIEAWVTLSEKDMAIFEHDPELLLYASVEPSPHDC
uniref:vinorine synthase-like n=1 Tax=Erigeron canadensis TaxID=72917 RepID=UPI001CB97563|nr:vinorine synthase-like [Erigeron canadensis]